MFLFFVFRFAVLAVPCLAHTRIHARKTRALRACTHSAVCKDTGNFYNFQQKVELFSQFNKQVDR
jgi:hypothetical protein